MRTLIVISGLFLCLNLTAQKTFQAKFLQRVNLMEVKEDFGANLVHLEAPHPGNESARAHLEKIKQEIPAKDYSVRLDNASNKKQIPRPFVFRNFNGNPYIGIPNDNHLAVSNDGKIISVSNSVIRVYEEDGTELLRTSLQALSINTGITNHKYDPRVMYDVEEDRFCLVYLNGSTDSTSYIMVAFSETNDPSGDWNVYYLPGNPLDDVSWSDYPMLALSDNELIITMNLLKNGGTWQESFKQTVIWLVDKADGYNGDSLIDSRLVDGLNFGGKSNDKPVRNVCPVRAADGNLGDDIYFISNRNFALENDSFFFITLQGGIKDGQSNVKVELLKSDINYGAAPNASQPIGVLEFQTNDARVLDAYLQNNRILFVSNSVVPENNFAGIYFGEITNVDANKSLKGRIIGSDSLEFGYPGIAWAGEESGDNEALIFVNHSSSDINPGCGVFYFDGTGVSEYKYVKEGNTYISIIGGPQRWGDYIGIQRKYNSPGLIWVAGTFGRKASGIGGGNVYGTWIAEIAKYGYASIEGSNKNEPISSTVYPNPVPENARWTIDFELERKEYISFDLYSIDGRHIRQLLRNTVKSGKNQFSFNTESLRPGSYFLVLTNPNGQVIIREQIMLK